MISWETAWSAALYGPRGFYRRPEGPAGHFRTASHAAAPVLAAALAELAGRSGCRAVVDVGAGRGELLAALAECEPGLRLHGVDVVAHPPALKTRAPSVTWSTGMERVPAGAFADALVVAWELLDVVACPVIEVDQAGVPRSVLVDPGDGREDLGDTAGEAELAWCRRWWPLTGPGERAEVGLPRDRVWGELVRRGARDGGALLLTVDYAHARDRRPPTGTLAGYRHGRLVPPVPDGSCDITAHVALDAVAAAGEAAGARTVEFGDQRTALRALGVTGRLRPDETTSTAGLARLNAEAELIDPDGLGGFGWLLQRVL